eukprot:2633434-Pleurochrysis_carterae.AAC.2
MRRREEYGVSWRAGSESKTWHTSTHKKVTQEGEQQSEKDYRDASSTAINFAAAKGARLEKLKRSRAILRSKEDVTQASKRGHERIPLGDGDKVSLCDNQSKQVRAIRASSRIRPTCLKKCSMQSKWTENCNVRSKLKLTLRRAHCSYLSLPLWSPPVLSTRARAHPRDDDERYAHAEGGKLEGQKQRLVVVVVLLGGDRVVEAARQAERQRVGHDAHHRHVERGHRAKGVERQRVSDARAPEIVGYAAHDEVEDAGRHEADRHGAVKVWALLRRHLRVHLGEGGVSAEAEEHKAGGDAPAAEVARRVVRTRALAQRLVEESARVARVHRHAREKGREHQRQEERGGAEDADDREVGEVPRAHDEYRHEEHQHHDDARDGRRQPEDGPVQVQQRRPVGRVQHDEADRHAVALQEGDCLHCHAPVMAEHLLGQLVVRAHVTLPHVLSRVGALALIQFVKRPNDHLGRDARDNRRCNDDKQRGPACHAERVWQANHAGADEAVGNRR